MHRVHGDRDHDQQAGAAEVEGHVVPRHEDLRQDRHQRQVDRADRGQAHEHVVDVVGRVPPGADARNEAAVLLQVLRRVVRIEDDRGVEEREEDDQGDVEAEVERLAAAQQRGHGGQPVRTALAREAGHRQRHQQERGGEDQRDHAGAVQLDRQVRALAAEHLIADLALGVLHDQPALRALDEDDEGDHRDRHHQDADDHAGRERAGAAQLHGAGEGARQVGDDAGEDDQRDAVAHAALGDLLAQPHQEDRAAGERDHRDEAEEQPGVDHRRAAARRVHPLQPHGDAVGLHRGQADRAVAGVLVDLLSPGLAFLLQLLQRRRDGGEQLHDNRRRDVGHDRQREDRHAPQRAAGEHVEHAEHALRLLLEDAVQGDRIDPRHRDVGAQAVDHQRGQREPDPLLQLRRLGEAAEVDVLSQLLGGGCHGSGVLTDPSGRARTVGLRS